MNKSNRVKWNILSRTLNLSQKQPFLCSMFKIYAKVFRDGETQVDPPRASLNKSATKCSNIKGSSFIKFEEYVGGFSALSVLKRIYKPMASVVFISSLK